MLKASRFYLKYGAIEIGYIPTSDGYGNVELDLTIIITYGCEFMALTHREVNALLNVVNSWKYAERYQTGCDNFNSSDEYGEFFAEQIDGKFRLIHTSAEGDITGINGFEIRDMRRLANIIDIIESQIDAMAFDKKNVTEEIEELVDKYRFDIPKFIRDAAYWLRSSDLIAEIAANFLKFFSEIVRESNDKKQ